MAKGKPSKESFTLGIIVLCVAIIFGVKAYLMKGDLSTGGIKARSKGDPQASVKVIEYIDFQCPACAHGAMVLKKYMEDNPDSIYLEMHYYPLSMHKHAITASIFAECAVRQNKFWSFHDLILERQNDWKGFADVKRAFFDMAAQAGLNAERLQSCINDHSIEEIVFKDKEEGSQKGVKSTPTYFINGEMVVGSRFLVEKLDQLIPLKNP